MTYYATPQRKFDGSPLCQYAQHIAVENPDSRHWENVSNNNCRTATKIVGTREMQKAADMLSADWFERRTWKQLAEAWQRVIAAANVKTLDAVGICELLDAAPQSEAIPF